MKLLDAVFEAVVDISEITKMTRDEFIERAKKVHGDKYNYTKVNYINTETPVEIICNKKDKDGNEHGPWRTLPTKHMKSVGGSICPKCNAERLRELYSSTTDEFIERAKKVHGDKYDYSKVNYVNAHEPVSIICDKKDENDDEHGPFTKTPKNHLSGSGCPKCSAEKKRQQYALTTDEFIERARKVHGDKYEYGETKYVNAHTPVLIICNEKNKNGNEHGPFLQLPTIHARGSGCPICVVSKGEKEIKELLDKQGIKYIQEYQNKYCTSFKNRTKKCTLLEFDFYLSEMNVLIEFDGVYHFKKYHSNTNDDFMSSVLNDREKNSFTKLKGIKLIRISYLDKDNVVDEVINGLKSKEQLYLSKSYGEHKTGWMDDNFQPTTKFIKKYT
jgi:very-short-patch-repair endonuclease